MPKAASEPFTASAGSSSVASDTNNHPGGKELIKVVMRECGSFEIIDVAQQAKAEPIGRAALIRELQSGKLEAKLEEPRQRRTVLSNAKIELTERDHAKRLANEDLREQPSALQQPRGDLLLEKEELN
jgi:hypothetical protein